MARLFRLHIGIDTYPGVPHKNLRGGVNDATRWASLLQGRGLVAAQVDGWDWPGAKQTLLLDEEADRATILACLERINQEMTRGDHAIVTFSGHGTADPDPGDGPLGSTLAICPSDVNAELDQVIWLPELAATMREHLDNTTWVIDACYSGETARTGRSLGHLVERRAGAKVLSGDRVLMQMSRFLLGCRPWEMSYEIDTAAGAHGAFSFALQTMLSRWSVKADASGDRYFNVDYGDLMDRVSDLLRTFGLPQTPMSLGRDRLTMVPVLRSGIELSDGATSRYPDGWKSGSQLSAGDTINGFRIYKIWVHKAGGAWVGTMAYVLVPTSNGPDANNPTFIAGTEYWSIQKAQLNHIYDSSGQAIVDGMKLFLIADEPWTSFDQSQWGNKGTGTGQASVSPTWTTGTWQPSSTTDASANLNPTTSSDRPLAVRLQFAKSSTQAWVTGLCWQTTSADNGPWFDDMTVGGDPAEFGSGATTGARYCLTDADSSG